MAVDKNYCIYSVKKRKTSTQLKEMYEHNHRLMQVSNAEEDKDHLNEYMMNIGAKTYEELFDESIKESPYYQSGNKYRKDAVKAFEVMATFSPEAMGDINIEEWKKRTIEFTQERFGKDNVKDIVLHNDESTPHFHFFIVPMTEEHKLNGSHYINNKWSLTDIQDKYAEKMVGTGLERGERKSFAKKETVKKFYGIVNEAESQVLSPPAKGENINEYYERAKKEYEKKNFEIAAVRYKAKRAFDMKMTEYVNGNRKKNAELYKQIKKTERLSESVARFRNYEKASEAMDNYFYIEKALSSSKKLNPDFYKQSNQSLQNLIQIGRTVVEKEREVFEKKKNTKEEKR